MIKSAYQYGFTKACLDRGIDPAALTKWAQDAASAALLDRATNPYRRSPRASQPAQYPTPPMPAKLPPNIKQPAPAAPVKPIKPLPFTGDAVRKQLSKFLPFMSSSSKPKGQANSTNTPASTDQSPAAKIPPADKNAVFERLKNYFANR